MPRSLPRASLIKLPRQQRSIAMVHTVLDAAVRVLTEDGPERFSTNRVAEVAGVSVGSLYQYFANKEMLLTAVVERAIRDVEEMARDAVIASEEDAEVVLRRLVYALLSFFEPHGEIVRGVFELVPVVSGNSLATMLEMRLMEAAREYLLRNSHRYQLIGGMAGLYVAVNGMIFAFLKWLAERPPSVPREELVDAVVRHAMVCIRRV